MQAQLQLVVNTKLEVARWLREELVCRLQLWNAYAPQAADVSPRMTRTTTGSGCVGYLLFRPACLALSGWMPLPENAEVLQEHLCAACLPNDRWLSEHLVLVAEFMCR